MSVNDICELGSILQGDDHEKAELERQVMAIDTAIQQQEARVRLFYTNTILYALFSSLVLSTASL